MNDKFKEGYERIFGDKLPEKGCWVFDPEQCKLIPKAEYSRKESEGPAIIGSMAEFRSPIDGTVITDRGKLRAHNQAHGVTSIDDYGANGGKEYFARKQTERDSILRGDTSQAKAERIETIKHAMDTHRG